MPSEAEKWRKLVAAARETNRLYSERLRNALETFRIAAHTLTRDRSDDALTPEEKAEFELAAVRSEIGYVGTRLENLRRQEECLLKTLGRETNVTKPTFSVTTPMDPEPEGLRRYLQGVERANAERGYNDLLKKNQLHPHSAEAGRPPIDARPKDVAPAELDQREAQDGVSSGDRG